MARDRRDLFPSMPARATLLLWSTAIVVALGLKIHYSLAGAGALTWVLAPTARLVEALSGMPFAPAGGAGYLNVEHGILIAPSCAGVNFMAMSLCMAVLAGTGRFPSPGGKCSWFLASAAGAYSLTLVVNAVRIVLSIHLYRADIYGGILTPERLHRLEGVIVYFTALTGIFLLIRRLPPPAGGDGRAAGTARAGLQRARFRNAGALAAAAPLAWYLLFTVLIPYLNGAGSRLGSFGEHCLTVAAGCAIVLLALLLIELGSRQPGSHPTTHETKNPDR